MTTIYFDNGLLSFAGEKLATREQYDTADRCVGSIFEAIAPSEKIALAEGEFILDEDLDLVEDLDMSNNHVYEVGSKAKAVWVGASTPEYVLIEWVGFKDKTPIYLVKREDAYDDKERVEYYLCMDNGEYLEQVFYDKELNWQELKSRLPLEQVFYDEELNWE